MSEESKRLEPKDNPWSWRTTGIIIICTLAANIMPDIGLLAFPFGLLLAYSVAFLIGYWIPPRPPLTYPKFAVRVISYLLIMLAGFWAIPKLLSKVLWVPLAYGLPTLILAISIYWMPPIYPVKKKPERFWVWLLFSIGFAVLYGWAMKSEGK